ncbi:MAG: hypothetical protein RLZZ312_620 [Bacteroidota bacterium]
MGNFKEHIDHSIKNARFLSQINNSITDSWDWQVTVCFYTALHLINAHIVKKTNSNYLSHRKVEEIINPFNQLSVARLNEDVYMSYIKLFQLSRRSRYLLNENFQKSEKMDIQNANFTYGKHLRKAIHHLDIIFIFIKSSYGEQFEIVDIKCLDLTGLKFDFFRIST